MVKRENSKYYHLISALIFIPSFNYYLSELMVKNWGLFSPTAFFYITLYVLSLVAVFLLLFKKTSLFLIFVFLSLLAVLNTYLFGNFKFAFTEWNDLPYNPIYKFVFLCLPYLFLPVFIKSPLKLLKILFVYSLINTLIALFTFVSFLSKSIQYEYMSFSYNMLFSSTFVFYYSTVHLKKRIVPLLVSIMSFAVIALAGSRGALICLLTYLLFFFLFIKNKKNSVKKSITIILIILLFGIVFFNIQSIASFLSDILGKEEFTSRVLDRIGNDSFFTDKNRSLLYKTVLQSILDKPIFGNGLFGDRKIVFYNLPEYPDGTYTHNILLEFFCEFGLIVGLISLLVVAFYFCGFLKRNRNNVYFDFALALFSCEFIRLLFTGSFLESPAFFFMIGLVFFEAPTYAKGINYCSDVQLGINNRQMC